MNRRLKIAISTPLILIGIYVGTFSCYWFLSPSKVTMWQGRTVREVSFQTRFDSTWRPAFWFVEHVGGYFNYQYAGGIESDIYIFTKFLDTPNNSPEPPPIAHFVPHSRLTVLAARLSFCR
jgi:hypothetical protein